MSHTLPRHLAADVEPDTLTVEDLLAMLTAIEQADDQTGDQEPES